MDNRIALDRSVFSRSKTALEESARALSEPIGTLAETLRAHSRPDEPSEVAELIGAAIVEKLRERNVTVDGAIHGVFDERNNFAAGPKTVNDIWALVPFENYLVTACLTADEIKAVMEEVYARRESRSLVGFEIEAAGAGHERRIIAMRSADGHPLKRDKRFVIAFNSFDSRSAGHRFMKLRTVLETPAANCTLHPVLTRDAIINYFRRHGTVHTLASAHVPPNFFHICG